MSNFKRLIIAVALCALLLMSSVAFAQEESETVSEPAVVSEELPEGGATAMLLLGIIAVGGVGLYFYIRERSADTSLPKS